MLSRADRFASSQYSRRFGVTIGCFHGMIGPALFRSLVVSLADFWLSTSWTSKVTRRPNTVSLASVKNKHTNLQDNRGPRSGACRGNGEAFV